MGVEEDLGTVVVPLGSVIVDLTTDSSVPFASWKLTWSGKSLHIIENYSNDIILIEC